MDDLRPAPAGPPGEDRSPIRSAARLAAVRASGLLDTPPEEPFDRLTALAAELLDVPYAFVTVVDDARSFWKSCVGVPAGGPRQNTVAESFCQYVVDSGEPLVVGDARADPRTADNPSIDSMGVAAWLGHPVRAPGGEILGTFCVVDTRTRPWTPREERVVATLAQAASSEVALRAAADEARSTAAREAARFQVIAEQTTDVVVMASAEGRVAYVNPAGRALLGLRGDADLTAGSLDDFLPAHARARLGREVLPAARRSGVWTGELEVLDAAGSPVPLWQAIVAHRDEDGALAFFSSIARDVRARRRAEAELHAQRQRYETLVEQAPVGIFLADRQGRVSYVNDRLAALVGAPADRVAGTDWAELIDPDDRGRVQDGWHRAVAERRDWADEHRIVCPDGSRRLVSASARPLRDAAGVVTGFLGTATDVTEQREVERSHRLAAAEQAARQESEAAAARLQQLARATVEISAAGTVERALEAVTRTARDLIGAHQAMTSLTAGQDGAQAVTAVSLSEKYAAWRGRPLPTDGSGLPAVVCRTNRPMRLTEAELRAHPDWRGSGSRTPEDLPTRGWLAAPLVGADGANLGLVQLSDRYRGEFTAEDSALLAQLTQVAAATLEKAALLRRQTAVALTLQRAMLGPADLPAGFAVRYEPASGALEVGGDWYDLAELSDGRFGVVVGDVVGRGLPAAAVMGQLRSAGRALLLEDSAPAAVLGALDRFAARLPGAGCSTVFCAVIDPARRRIRYSSAGHLPAILADPDGGHVLLDRAQSLPLGVVADLARPEAEAHLGDGSTLLLYTDGLVERRGQDLDAGIDGAAGVLAAAQQLPPEGLADLLTRRLLEDGHDDDVAFLLYRPGHGHS